MSLLSFLHSDPIFKNVCSMDVNLLRKISLTRKKKNPHFLECIITVATEQ